MPKFFAIIHLFKCSIRFKSNEKNKYFAACPTENSRLMRGVRDKLCKEYILELRTEPFFRQ